MRKPLSSALVPFLLGSSLVLLLPGCESSGGLRVASVGNPPASGGGDGSGTDQGGTGGDKGTGGGGNGDTGGTGGGTGGAGALLSGLPVGGVVGPDGVGGTGLLANTGDPSNPNVAAPVLTTAGNAVLGVAGTTGKLVPDSTPIVGTVEKVLADTGQALVRAGDGSGYLVDGLTAAPGSAVTIAAGNATLVGTPGSNPLIGVSALSNTQTQGSLLTAGVSAAGNLVTAAGPEGTGGTLGNTVSALVPSNATGALGSATGAVGTIADVAVGNNQLLGGGAQAAVGASVISPTQPSGSVASVGVASGGKLLDVKVPALGVGTSASGGSTTTGGGLLGALPLSGSR